jgi:hypothetical protein
VLKRDGLKRHRFFTFPLGETPLNNDGLTRHALKRHVERDYLKPAHPRIPYSQELFSLGCFPFARSSHTALRQPLVAGINPEPQLLIDPTGLRYFSFRSGGLI